MFALIWRRHYGDGDDFGFKFYFGLEKNLKDRPW